MKFAFIILSHKKPDCHFKKLLQFLNLFSDSRIIVHHDFYQSEFTESLVQEFNVYLVKPCYKTQWGHISKIPAILSTFETAKRILPDFDWLISISPNCYPIKSVESITDFFFNPSMDYFMDTHPLGLQYESVFKWHYRAMFTKRICKIPFVSRKGKFYWRHIRFPINRNNTPFNDSMYPHAGSDWYFLNNKTVTAILNADLINHPMTHYLAEANKAPDMNSSPDEIIIQTFLRNQKDLNGGNWNYRFIDWSNAVNWHPNTLTMDHWDDLKRSEALFARKFDVEKSDELIQYIEKYLLVNQEV